MPLIHVWNHRGVEFGGDINALQSVLREAVKDTCELKLAKNSIVCLGASSSDGPAVIIVELLPIDPFCNFTAKTQIVKALGKAYKRFCSGEFHEGERRRNYYNGVVVIIREASPANWPHYSDLLKYDK